MSFVSLYEVCVFFEMRYLSLTISLNRTGAYSLFSFSDIQRGSKKLSVSSQTDEVIHTADFTKTM